MSAIIRPVKQSDIPAMASIRGKQWESEAYWEHRISAYLAGATDTTGPCSLTAIPLGNPSGILNSPPKGVSGGASFAVSLLPGNRVGINGCVTFGIAALEDEATRCTSTGTGGFGFRGITTFGA